MLRLGRCRSRHGDRVRHAHGEGHQPLALDDDFAVVGVARAGAGAGTAAAAGAAAGGFAGFTGFRFGGGVDVDGDYVDYVGGGRFGDYRWAGDGGWWGWGERLEDYGRWGRGRGGADYHWRGWWRRGDDGGYSAPGFPDARLRGVADVEVFFVAVFAFAGIHWEGGVSEGVGGRRGGLAYWLVSWRELGGKKCVCLERGDCSGSDINGVVTAIAGVGVEILRSGVTEQESGERGTKGGEWDSVVNMYRMIRDSLDGSAVPRWPRLVIMVRCVKK